MKCAEDCKNCIQIAGTMQCKIAAEDGTVIEITPDDLVPDICYEKKQWEPKKHRTESFEF